jgi:hypothetical protein
MFEVFTTENVKESVAKQRERIEFVLKNYPESRNNDNILCRLYWQMYEGMTSVDDLDHVTDPGSITRIRRMINHERKYLPTDPAVARRRRIGAEIYREALAK